MQYFNTVNGRAIFPVHHSVTDEVTCLNDFLFLLTAKLSMTKVASFDLLLGLILHFYDVLSAVRNPFLRMISVAESAIGVGNTPLCSCSLTYIDTFLSN